MRHFNLIFPSHFHDQLMPICIFQTAVTPVVVPECSSLISPPSLERERGAGDEKMTTSLMTMKTSTPLMTMMMKNTGKHPVAPMMSIGVTPIR